MSSVGVSSVGADYTHIHKIVEAAPAISLPPGHDLKWYNISAEHAPVPEDVQQEAREFLRAEVKSGRLALSEDLGFVILHRVGDAFLLLVCTWRYDNELWETVYLKDAAGFALFPREETHKPCFCVWEMGAVLHEQQAWTRYLFSARDRAAQRAYLADQAERVVV